MSRNETERAVALIRRLTDGRTLLIVEHDMSVVFGLADRISTGLPSYRIARLGLVTFRKTRISFRARRCGWSNRSCRSPCG